MSEIFLSNNFLELLFKITSLALGGSSAFFILQNQNVAASWRTTINVAAIVTGIASFNYIDMLKISKQNQDIPITSKYIDLFITIPLVVSQFYFILAAVRKENSGILVRLLLGTLVMLAGHFLGSIEYNIVGLVMCIGGWLFINYEVFAGKAAKTAARSGNKALVVAFGSLRIITAVGFAMYPLGSILGPITGIMNDNLLHIFYTLVSSIIQIVCGLIVWNGGLSSSSRRA